MACWCDVLEAWFVPAATVPVIMNRGGITSIRFVYEALRSLRFIYGELHMDHVLL
jgi:hypothetical protein